MDASLRRPGRDYGREARKDAMWASGLPAPRGSVVNVSVLEGHRPQVNSGVSTRTAIWFGYAVTAPCCWLCWIARVDGCRHRGCRCAQRHPASSSFYGGRGGPSGVACCCGAVPRRRGGLLGRVSQFHRGQRAGSLNVLRRGTVARRDRVWVYEVWIRDRDLSSLGIGAHNWRPTLVTGAGPGLCTVHRRLRGLRPSGRGAVGSPVRDGAGGGLVRGSSSAGSRRRLEASSGPGAAVAGAAVLYAALICRGGLWPGSPTSLHLWSSPYAGRRHIRGRAAATNNVTRDGS